MCVYTDTLWVEKYKPRSTSELVGNQTNVSTLRQWLHQWEDVNLKGATPVQARGGGYQVGCGIGRVLGGQALLAGLACSHSHLLML
jgi:hypothetical protein